MTSLVDAIYHVKYNPFKFSEYMASFYLELDNVEQNIMLSQLVIPLCSHHEFSAKLLNPRFNGKNKSTLFTIFKEKSKLYDLQERLDKFKSLTELSLQYCLVNDWLEVEIESMTVSSLEVMEMPYKRQRQAANLGKLLSNLSVIDIYSFLGVKPR